MPRVAAAIAIGLTAVVASGCSSSAHPTSAPTSPDTLSTSVPNYAVAVMTRTVEVNNPDEHFKPGDLRVSTADGHGGTISAFVAIRTPSADGHGQLVFFFHNRSFLRWDAAQEANSILRVVASGPDAIAVTYNNLAAHDPPIGGSLPPATVIYRWDGHQITPQTRPPPGIYGLNDPTVNVVRVRLAS